VRLHRDLWACESIDLVAKKSLGLHKDFATPQVC